MNTQHITHYPVILQNFEEVRNRLSNNTNSGSHQSNSITENKIEQHAIQQCSTNQTRIPLGGYTYQAIEGDQRSFLVHFHSFGFADSTP